MSVGALLALAPARGLFHRAMLISGAASAGHPLHRAVEVAEGLLQRLGLSRPFDVDKLLALEPAALVEAAAGYRIAGGGMTFQPCIDGTVLEDLPLTLARNGAADGVPLLVGTQRDEWRGFTRSNPLTANLDEDGLVAQVAKNVEDAPSLIDGYRRIGQRRGTPTDPVSLFAAIETDRKMRLPAMLLAEAMAERGQSAHHYIFAGESPWEDGALGSPHAIIIGFVFGTHAFSEESAAFFGKGESADALSAHLQDAIAASGANRQSGAPEALDSWRPYDAQSALDRDLRRPAGSGQCAIRRGARSVGWPGDQPAFRCGAVVRRGWHPIAAALLAFVAAGAAAAEHCRAGRAAPPTGNRNWPPTCSTTPSSAISNCAAPSA